MSDIAIKVESISKKYQIGENKNFPTLRDKLMELPNRLFKGPKKNKEFWALKDVSFEVKKGEVVGIIGRNGAGKSTMLKILARITEPTSGKVTMYGRVASMLEVGTGFNPELTGRENIYLNGAIIGMTKKEIKQKFDEIVEFSGVGKFLDTPVKHYSSGMYVRLAFAVAAHLDADILLVDEVLAVGDAEFQKKCLGRMSDLSHSGKTVILVSHNTSAVRSLCTHIILLEKGEIIYFGNPELAINKYLNQAQNLNKYGVYKEKISSQKPFQVISVSITDINGKSQVRYENSTTIKIELSIKISKPYHGLYGYMTIYNQEGIIILESDSFDTVGNPLKELTPGMHKCRITIPGNALRHGKYSVYINFSSSTSSIYHNAYPGMIGSFELEDTKTPRGNNRKGYVGAIIHWEDL